MTTTGHQTLYENFDETIEPVKCNVLGTIPAWLTGNLLRNGPGMFRIGETEYQHWFDGLAFIQCYRIKDGQMWYSARFLQSDTYKTNMAANRIAVSEFGTTAFPDPCKNFFYRFLSHFDTKMTDNAVVNFVRNGDKIYATTETPWMRRIDGEDTLEIIGDKSSMGPIVAVNTETAHHHMDRDGNLFNIGSRFGRNGQFVFTKTDKNADFEQTKVIGSIPIGNDFHPPYYHSFGMSENYMILFESPLRINALTVLSQPFTGHSYHDAMYWDGKQKTKIHILNHKTGEKHPVIYESEAFFTFHHANCYETTAGQLVVDFCKFKNGAAIKRFTLKEMRQGKIINMSENERPYFHRMIIPLEFDQQTKLGMDLLAGNSNAGKCRAILKARNTVCLEDERMADIAFEFPRINYDKANGLPYRFAYGSAMQQMSIDSLIGIVKLDVENRKLLTWQRERYEQICAEPVFIPKPGATEEDEGILICPVLESTSIADPFVVFLDAGTMEEIARAIVPTRLPLGFHAIYVPKN